MSFQGYVLSSISFACSVGQTYVQNSRIVLFFDGFRAGLALSEARRYHCTIAQAIVAMCYLNLFCYLVGGLEHFLFSHILGIIIPIDFHIFQRGGPTTNQVIIGTSEQVGLFHTRQLIWFQVFECPQIWWLILITAGRIYTAWSPEHPIPIRSRILGVRFVS